MSMARPVVGALAARLPATSTPIRTLHAVSPTPVRRRRPKIFFAFVTVVTIFIIIVAQILLSVSLQSGAYEISGLQRNVKELGRTYQSATQDLNRMTSPQNVAQSAEVLGMVGNSNPVYLRLSDSLVTGAATTAAAGGALVAQGNLVPNAMLAEVIAQREAAARLAAAAAAAQLGNGASGTPAGNPAPGSEPAPVSPVVTVPSPQGLPSPATR
jgi:cell division protein FtsL